MQQVEFFACQFDWLAVHVYGAHARIDLQIVVRDRFVHAIVRRRRGATQHIFHARHHFARAERFDDVIVRAEFQTQHAIHLIAARGQHNDRHRALRAQTFEHFQAIEFGQHQIEDNQIGRVRIKRGERGVTIICRVHTEAVACEVQFQDFENLGFIVHNENVLTDHHANYTIEFLRRRNGFLNKLLRNE